MDCHRLMTRPTVSREHQRSVAVEYVCFIIIDSKVSD